MRRREVIVLVGGAVGLWPLAPRAQQPAVPVVGYLSTFPESGRSFGSAIFRKALSDAGYVDGQNVAIEFRSSDGQTSRLQSVADKLVAERVAVIVASQFVAGFAAKNATATIPIIFTVGSSPAALEQVRSMIRPDGNVTAVSQMLPPIAPKRLEIIRELMPDAKTVAFLDNPVGQAYPAESESIALSEAAEALGIRIEVLQARNNDEMEKLFGAWTGQQGNALIVTPHPFYISVRPRLIELANSHAIPTIYPFYEDAVAGGLMSYGNSNFDIYRQMAAYTARILDGERPGDLPIMQPVKISLTINMKTAKELGLTVPQSLLTRADKVIT